MSPSTVGSLLCGIGIVVAFCADFLWDNTKSFYHPGSSWRLALTLIALSLWALMVLSIV